MSRSSTNCSVIVDRPKALFEFIEFSPAISPNWRSSGVVTSDSMTSGLAPGSWVVTWMVGNSTAGSAEIGRLR